jgi:hypothetical protein
LQSKGINSVASLADDASAALIINQIDRVISRAYG